MNIITEYICRDCGKTLILENQAPDDVSYADAREYALLRDRHNTLMSSFEKKHSKHVYNQECKFEAVGDVI